MKQETRTMIVIKVIIINELDAIKSVNLKNKVMSYELVSKALEYYIGRI